ncbi:MAG: hypothetical protein IKU38_04055 [Clostridia bacterium]|nr:hypothetical protein [Clostridia bacterium]
MKEGIALKAVPSFFYNIKLTNHLKTARSGEGGWAAAQRNPCAKRTSIPVRFKTLTASIE